MATLATGVLAELSPSGTFTRWIPVEGFTNSSSIPLFQAFPNAIAEKIQLTNKQAAAFLDNLADVALKETKKNGVFVLPGLGRLKKVQRKARTGRNPQTGEPIQIKAKTVAKFYVAKAAKDAIAPPKR